MRQIRYFSIDYFGLKQNKLQIPDHLLICSLSIQIPIQIVRLNLGGEAPSLILDAIVIFHLHIKRNIGFFLRVFGCCSRGTPSQFLW